jgi:hypothetical protein
MQATIGLEWAISCGKNRHLNHARELRLTDLPEDLVSRLNCLEAMLAASHTCRTRLRLRVVAGGAQHYVKQCIDCGEQVGGPLSKAVALPQLKEGLPEQFDATLFTRYSEHRQAQWQEVLSLKSALTAIDNPTLAQQKQEALAADRAREAKAQESIAKCMDALCSNVSNEMALTLLERFVASTRERLWQERIVEHKGLASEPALKAWLVRLLSQDFDLTPEVPGKHLFEEASVTIDYIARAKPHLVEEGFTADPFGIEVKHLKADDGFSSKASRGFWQTISYTDCEFNLNETPTRLRFAVLFSNMSFNDEVALLRNFGSLTENDWAVWRAFCQLANHAQVATLAVKGTKDAPKGWAFKFSGGTYFTARFTQGGASYRLSDSNLITKTRIGNF